MPRAGPILAPIIVADLIAGHGVRGGPVRRAARQGTTGMRERDQGAVRPLC